mmetsp:Transcript_22361/g.33037  ORF Transcript_22361/g.33037 Transcript_22361/m.33037 type:complete len:423 (+) Transcript_22361:158-1426(+)|eukprot:CAMPEP_0194199644 /NCGR_PEP_ID=MMETSP0156-20130528/588_1 /TAXON_ID=33649 /ORGANISM="Thalassionema nitzschioides, Strain L26-B" /LENGTH=422 /DNA_ID=CAMNT_0038924573 /DNA_START=127 /DNA_END=1395 /DNA_ORIENTATION=+
MFEIEKPEGAAAEEARAKAEARRRRILEKSNQRFGVVSGEEPKGNVTEEKSEATTAPSSSSRMQAMRRRRYKKSSQQSKEEPDKASAKEGKKEESRSAETLPREEVDTQTATITEVRKKDDGDATAQSQEKRKYKGVAAMRRQRLKEKAAATSKENSEKVATKAALKSPKLTMNKIPIILHMLIIFVLFGIGFKLGIDQVVDENIVVHSTLLAPQEHGISLLSIFDKGSKKADSQKVFPEEESVWSNEEIPDEFGKHEESFDEGYEPKIDPLFQVDLDLYTKGDSIFMILARFTVSLHRLMLKVIYYTPLAMFTALIRIPGKLLETPPILCLLSVVVRQFGKRVLGAGLPEELQEIKKQDIMAMVKNGVMNFLANSFPTFVGLYDAFTHLRSDIFIVLCGLFVGLAWNHHGLTPTGSDHDEL